ncbi:MAG: ABC transporter ATP-binding protein [Planctomycetaceae bacterium]
MNEGERTLDDLRLERVSKEYRGAAGTVSVLAEVNLRMRRGEALAIMGPSGAGKSTLLYIIGTLDTPTGGRVQIVGEDPFRLAERELAAFRNRHIGFVFQDHHLLPQCTVWENVLIPTLGAQADAEVAAARERADRLLTRVGLAHRRLHRPAELSGGERQRASVCRALIQQPRLLLADEPTGNLDRTTAQQIGSLLLEMCVEFETVLVTVTHSQELAARFPRRAELVDGRLREEP